MGIKTTIFTFSQPVNALLPHRGPQIDEYNMKGDGSTSLLFETIFSRCTKHVGSCKSILHGKLTITKTDSPLFKL